MEKSIGTSIKKTHTQSNGTSSRPGFGTYKCTRRTAIVGHVPGAACRSASPRATIDSKRRHPTTNCSRPDTPPFPGCCNHSARLQNKRIKNRNRPVRPRTFPVRHRVEETPRRFVSRAALHERNIMRRFYTNYCEQFHV